MGTKTGRRSPEQDNKSGKTMSTLIKTYDNDIYVIKGKEPSEILALLSSQDFVEMPNGSVISKKSISTMQTHEDYKFQVDQKQRHKKGQYLLNGSWHDDKGYVAVAEISSIKKLTK